MSTGTNILYAGIDWGTKRHQACVVDAGGEVLGERAFDHDGPGLTKLVDWLLSLTNGGKSRRPF